MKKYLVSEDEFSGQVVIECEEIEVEVNVYQPTSEEMLSAIYLYRELPEEIEIQKRYRVRAYFHYEDKAHRYSNCLFNEWGMTKEEGNELFKMALLMMR